MDDNDDDNNVDNDDGGKSLNSIMMKPHQPLEVSMKMASIIWCSLMKCSAMVCPLFLCECYSIQVIPGKEEVKGKKGKREIK